MPFWMIFFEFSENKRLFAPRRAIGRLRVGYGAPPSMVYCVYTRARYGAIAEKQPAETAILRGEVSFCRGFLRFAEGFGACRNKFDQSNDSQYGIG